MSLESFLRRKVPYKDIGWEAIGERFTRYQLLKTRWFNVYLHQLWAPEWHPECHDHPWSFVTVLLRGGYLEQTGNKIRWRSPGSVLYRPATYAHNVVTCGKVSWSLIFTTAKSRDWGFKPCDREGAGKSYQEYICEHGSQS